MALRGFGLFRRSSWTWSQSRRVLSNFAEKQAAEELHAEKTLVYWRRVSLFVALPGCFYLTWRSFFSGHDEHSEEKEYIPYNHLRIRTKPFPWGNGDTTLIHNPHVNLGPPKEVEPVKEKERWKWYEKIWLDYWIEDPDERDRKRYKHLRYMQKRRERYLKKKAEAIDREVPLQPMNLFLEMESRDHEEFHAGIDN